MKTTCIILSLTSIVLLSHPASAANIAYIHGDVASNGSIPSGSVEPFHKMMLDDTGNLGCSTFRQMVEGAGHTLTAHYDRETELDAEFLEAYDVVIFGLHQKKWSNNERKAVDSWLKAGGGILMYSDSASGGHYKEVGINNPVGQKAVNSILAGYGMQVAVDQGGGVRAYKPDASLTHPIIEGAVEFEGEGVSPIAIDPDGDGVALIPFDDEHMISGKPLKSTRAGISISNPQWAALAYCPVDAGHIVVIFDRQPMWNKGPGSDITKRDNKEILRRIIQFLADE